MKLMSAFSRDYGKCYILFNMFYLYSLMLMLFSSVTITVSYERLQHNQEVLTSANDDR